MICLNFHYKPWDVDELSYTDFNDDIKEIAIRVNFDSYKGIIGNSYAKDAGDILEKISPFNFVEHPKNERHIMTKEQALAFIGQRE